jgi:hypothetical protein
MKFIFRIWNPPEYFSIENEFGGMGLSRYPISTLSISMSSPYSIQTEFMLLVKTVFLIVRTPWNL